MNDKFKITYRSFNFAVKIVRLCQFLEKQDCVSRTLANQLVRSGTSVGANIEEAQAGHSKADFTAKMSIARKEARETFYWLKLFKATNFVEHYDERLDEGASVLGKVMFVSSSRLIAYDLYKQIIALKPEWVEVKECDDDVALTEHGYPPVPRDEVYKEIFEQVENFKKYRYE